MHQPSRWWVGLIALAVLWIVAGNSRIDGIEAEIAPRARQAVAASAPDVASAMTVIVAGRDVRIEGYEFSPGQGERSSAAAAELYGVRRADERLQAPAEAKPFAFQATRSGRQFTLSGNVPTPVLRDTLLKTASAMSPGSEIVDRLGYAAGAPAGFAEIATHGIGQAAQLEGGVFALSDVAYSITGTALTSDIYEAAIGATQRLPGGARLAKAEIAPPQAKPFMWTAIREGAKVTLSGVVPATDVRRTIADAAPQLLPGTTVTSRMQIARGAPAGDFAGFARHALADLARLSQGRVVVSDATYAISGEAATVEAYEQAMASTSKLPTGLTLARAEILPPVVKPYTWEARFDGNGVTLEGLAPSAAVRGRMASDAAAAFAGKTINNRIGIARGAPEGDFARATASLLQELARLKDGRASASDTQVSISGNAPTGTTSANVRQSLGAALAAPFTIAAVDIKEAVISPYVFQLDKGDGKVRLSGHAPDEKTKRDLVAAATSAFFADSVQDELKIGPGAPKQYLDTLKAIFPALARLWSGKLVVTDGSIMVDGLAVYGNAADQIKTALAGALPAGFKLSDVMLGVRPPAPALQVEQCQPAFEGLLGRGRIQFETGSAELNKDSLAVLDGLVDIAQRCAGATIEVAGHTDTVGAADDNLELSKRRAKAVVSYLGDAGIDVSRISSEGYGQTRPVASNDTAEGRAQNRRIEFVVK